MQALIDMLESCVCPTCLQDFTGPLAEAVAESRVCIAQSSGNIDGIASSHLARARTKQGRFTEAAQLCKEVLQNHLDRHLEHSGVSHLALSYARQGLGDVYVQRFIAAWLASPASPAGISGLDWLDSRTAGLLKPAARDLAKALQLFKEAHKNLTSPAFQDSFERDGELHPDSELGRHRASSAGELPL